MYSCSIIETQSVRLRCKIFSQYGGRIGYLYREELRRHKIKEVSASICRHRNLGGFIFLLLFPREANILSCRDRRRRQVSFDYISISTALLASFRSCLLLRLGLKVVSKLVCSLSLSCIHPALLLAWLVSSCSISPSSSREGA